MISHMKTQHKEINLAAKAGSSDKPSTSNDAPTHNRPSPYANIFKLRTHTDREAMLQTTIPDWVQSNNPLPFHSPKAQRIHKGIFEQMVVDLVPFHEVNKPGFLRQYYRLVPNFKVATAKYYRSLLEPTYDKIRDATHVFLLTLFVWICGLLGP